jgi:hypothetical protein
VTFVLTQPQVNPSGDSLVGVANRPALWQTLPPQLVGGEHHMKNTILSVAAVMTLAACGEPWNGVDGTYQGTTTITFSNGGSSSTQTTTGATVEITSGSQNGKLVLTTGAGVLTATLSGSALSIDSGSSGTMDSQSTTQTTITSGSGTATGTSLTLNLTGNYSQAQNGTTTNTAITFAFSGNKL